VGYVEGQEVPLQVTEQAAREAYVAAMAAAQAQQREAARFVVEHGPQVIGGHSDVGMVEAHNVGADPDEYPDASDA
jgi:hypothetical protein